MVSRLSEKSFSPRKCQFARKIFYENQRCFQKPLTSNNERRSQNAIPRDKIFYENGPYLRIYTENQRIMLNNCE